MANTQYLINASTLVEIGDAIRYKKGIIPQ
jgi:hypothetical protein